MVGSTSRSHPLLSRPVLTHVVGLAMPIRPVVNSSCSFERLCVSHFVIKDLFRLVTAATKLATSLLLLLLLLLVRQT